MMERIGHALGGDSREQAGEGKEEVQRYHSSGPQHEMQQVRSGVSTGRQIIGAAMFFGPSSSSDYSRGLDPIMDSSTMEGILPGTVQRSFPIPNLHNRLPAEMTRLAMNAHALTNTSPMQHPTERVVPSSATEIRMLDESSMRFLFKSPQDMDKDTSKVDSELDMNLPFPVKLHYILSNPKYHDCVVWLPHGRAWRILKPKAFERRVIPMFFRSAKYASFMRQVRQQLLMTLYFFTVSYGSVCHF